MSNTDSNPIQPYIQPTTSSITLANRWDHFLARVGWKRSDHLVEPGLYALCNPTEDSPVFVTANYTFSFDALRSALAGIDGYIMVLDTKGVNVWCAAGKGTFATDELVRCIKVTQLHDIVGHRVLILPQLGAPGVSAHEVKKRSGFKVEYGPVRATDLPEYLKTRQATPEMRQVRFPLRDRLTLIPIELIGIPLLIIAIVAVKLLFFRSSLLYEALAAVLAGVTVFPILLPWLPAHDFSVKGFILGGAVILPFALLAVFSHNPDAAVWRQICNGLTKLLIWPPVTAYFALNFTGATTFTSRSGVRREIFKYVPIMALMFGSGIILAVVLKLI